jgi:uncharacterized membrane protein
MNIPIARTINSASRPLLITDVGEHNVSKLGNLITLSYLLNSQANFLVWLPKMVEIPKNFNEIFLYGLDPKSKTEIEKNTRDEIRNIYHLKN